MATGINVSKANVYSILSPPSLSVSKAVVYSIVQDNLSYSNSGGSGLRYIFVIATSDCPWAGAYEKLILDGSFADSAYFNSTSAVANKYIKFEFPIPVVIDEAKWYQEQALAGGTWRWQGSNNNADWVDIGGTFVLGDTTPQIQTSLNGNTSAYKYYRLLGVSGNFQNNRYIREIEFKIEDYSTSYLNPIFGNGDRTANITASITGTSVNGGTVSELVDGLYTGGVWFDNVGVSDVVLKFDFGVGNLPIINEAIWVQDRSETHGTWRWAGSNNNSDWTTIGNSFTFGGIRNVHTELNGNTIGYRYYKLYGVSGTASNLPYLSEIIFNIAEEVVDHSVITLKYRTGATSALCEAATYAEYTVPFDSEGFVQLRVEG